MAGRLNGCGDGGMTALNDNLDVIILAAGLGTRMKSATIKILHRAAGRPIIDYVLDLAGAMSASGRRSWSSAISARRCSRRSAIARASPCRNEQLGTGHAVLQAAPISIDGANGTC